jgi:D-xylono/L-arabinono-1,4-lactonase
MKLESVADYACKVGENPLWHPGEQRLYWADIPAGRIFRYDPASGKHEQCYSGEVVGGFTMQADGALLLFMARGAVKIWRDGKLSTIIEEIPDEINNRFNDVIADPMGRVFCGTMSTPDRAGRLYQLDTDGTLTTVLEGIGTSNGLGFTPDRKHMYYTDSPKHEIYLFDYNQESGAISNQRIFVHTAEDEGVPDGMTVDAEGYVWSARWDGSCLVRYSPDATEERRIDFPVKKVSSVIFGGRDYTDMYVTTAGGDSKATDGALAGAVFRLNLGIKGVPEFPSRVGISS